MVPKSLVSAAVFCAAVASRAVSAEEASSAAAWIPQDAIIVVEISKPKELLDRVLDDQVTGAIAGWPAYQQQAAKPQFMQAAGLVKHYQDKYHVDFRGLLTKLFGGGVTWAIGPKQSSLLLVDTEDAKLLADVHEFFRLIAVAEAGKQGQPKRVASADYRGLTGWSFGPKEAHAIVGSRLLLTNKPDWLKAAADLRADPNGPSLANLPAYRKARAAVAHDAIASVYADLALLKQLPQLQKGLQGNENPLAALLLAPLLADLRESSWLALRLNLRDQTLAIEVAMDGAALDPNSPQGFATPPGSADGALPNLAVPRQIAGMSFYRDLHRFYAAKDELFPERTSGLIFFENMMGIFFTGRDLTDEVLAETKPEVRFVIAEQQYDPQVGTPRVQFPGFAAVFRMKNPEKFRPVAEEAFQKALGLINVTRGQKAEPGMILDRPVHAETKYSMYSFAPPSAQEDKSAVDSRFNFQPTLAMPGEHLILSSTDALARDLIDALQKETAGNVKPLAGQHTLVAVDGRRVASILGANRESLIQKNMLDKGHTREQAESELDVGLKIVDCIREVRLSMGGGDGQTRAKLDVSVELP